MFLEEKTSALEESFHYQYGATADAAVPDRFLHAWMMLKASASIGVSFFNRKKQYRDCRCYMDELQIFRYAEAPEEEKERIRAEWHAFFRYYLAICVNSKTYCSTLLALVPISNPAVARKIAEEVVVVTKTFPSKLGLAEPFLPFHEVMAETYCSSIADGKTYWDGICH